MGEPMLRFQFPRTRARSSSPTPLLSVVVAVAVAVAVIVSSKSSMALHVPTPLSVPRSSVSVSVNANANANANADVTANTTPPTPPILSATDVARKIWSTDGGLYETDVHAIVRCHCEEEKDGGEPPRYRLLYMPMRNRGEILRLMLEEARVPYEVEVVGWRNWIDGVKATTPHGKCPVLLTRDPDTDHSLSIGQEGAVTRYLADELGLAGRTRAERADVDSLYCLWFATLRNHGVSHDGDHFSVAALRAAADGTDGADAPMRRPRYEDVQRLQALHSYTRAERSLSVLDYFERRLVGNDEGPFLVGEGVTYVDLGLFYVLFELGEGDNVPEFGVRFGLPRLAEFVVEMEQRPWIGEYVRSPSRMPRYSRAVDGTSLYRYVEGRGSPRID